MKPRNALQAPSVPGQRGPIFGFDAISLIFIALATLVAFVVRGLSGFGSSMIGIGALSLLLPPAQVVPAFLAIELLSSTNLRPGVWRQIDWRSLRWVIAGCAIATPAGLLLAGLDPTRCACSSRPACWRSPC